MKQHPHQLFRHADIIQKVSASTINIPGTSLKSIQNTFPNAHHFELNGQPISFLPDYEGTGSQFIALYPDEVLDVFTEEPESSKSNAATYCSTLARVEAPKVISQDSQSSLSSSSGFVPIVPHNVEQTAMIKPKNEDKQQRKLGLLLEIKALQLETKEKEDKVVALQGKMLALQLEAKIKVDEMLALQLEAKDKEGKILALQEQMLRLQHQALGRLAVIHKQGNAILTQTYELLEYPIPRLFIVLPKNSSNISGQLNDQFRLYFLCECGEHTKKFSDKSTNIPHNIHLAKHEGYNLRRPKEFFQKYGRYMLTLLQMIKYGVMITSTAVPTLAAIKSPGIIDIFKDPLNAVSQSDVNDSIEYLQGLENKDSNDPANSSIGLDSLEGADLRHLEEFIKNEDRHRVLGNLYRIVTPDGHVKWVCIDHYSLAYMEKEQLAFAKAVQVNGGSYEPQLGKVVVNLGSKIRAAEFLDALAKARRVHDLDITFYWECNRSDIEVLKNALEKSRVSILRLDLREYQTSFGDKLFLKSRYEELRRIMELPNMKTIHIVLPREIVKLSSVQPNKLSHLHKLSFEMAPRVIVEKEFRELTEALKIDASLTTLSLELNSISDLEAQELSEGLKINSTLTTLHLVRNLIGNNGVQALSEALKINSTLTILKLGDNSIRDNGAQALSEVLRINSTLTILDLGYNLIGDNGAQALSEALTINTTLTTLKLTRNSIGGQGAQALSEALKINSTLTTLDLSYNSIGVNGAKAVSEALKINSALTTLDLRRNLIGNYIAHALSEALKTNSTLTTLDLGRNFIESDGAQALSEALKTNSTLATLDLKHNSIRDIGAQALSEALETNSTLITLDLGKNLIESDGAQALSVALEINSTLVTLDLEYNSIGDIGAQALSEALEINSTLTTLDLGKNLIQSYGAQALSEALKINSTLTRLDLWFNLIGDIGAQALSEALKTNSTLITLNLKQNFIQNSGAKALSEALKTNSTLTTLDLSENSIGRDGAHSLFETLKTSSTLTTLKLWHNSIVERQSLGTTGSKATTQIS
ncbi:hypothetical protein BGZ99_003386 [Dissophora globulifera]|uniref:Uncharacterized protein n=1 Tax=Dissophora globulifera TaxID=979702 RepID=A0A9P6RNB3_9FUNG|nr:hypothetical protein BGZ99_003386 [Dissophora globulifera]